MPIEFEKAADEINRKKREAEGGPQFHDLSDEELELAAIARVHDMTGVTSVDGIDYTFAMEQGREYADMAHENLELARKLRRENKF